MVNTRLWGIQVLQEIQMAAVLDQVSLHGSGTGELGKPCELESTPDASKGFSSSSAVATAVVQSTYCDVLGTACNKPEHFVKSKGAQLHRLSPSCHWLTRHPAQSHLAAGVQCQDLGPDEDQRGAEVR